MKLRYDSNFHSMHVIQIDLNGFYFLIVQVSDVPLMAGFLQLSPLDWKYKSEPQGTACLGEL